MAKTIQLQGSGVPSLSGIVGPVRAAVRRHAASVAIIAGTIAFAGVLADLDPILIAGAAVLFSLGETAGKGGAR